MIISTAETRRGAAFDQDFQKGHVCGECGGRLVEATCGQPGMLWVGCSNRAHEGFERVRSWYERWRSGEQVPITIAEGLRKLEAKGKKRKVRR